MRTNGPSVSDAFFPSGAGEQLDLHNLSDAQLMQLGMADIAYVKPVWMNGATAFAIHAADGSPMALAADCELAVAAIVQHEMSPAFVH